MRELFLAAGLCVLIICLGAVAMIPWRSLFFGSIWLVAVGFVVGVPTGVIYHVKLYRALKPSGALPAGWIWRPIQLNRKLGPDDRPGVMVWCYLGAAGFFAIAVGFVLNVTSMILAQQQGP